MRNHFIQRKLIEDFFGKNGILVYDIIEDRILPKLNNANNIAYEKNLYHFEKENYPDEQIERDLKSIEDNGIAAIQNISISEKLPQANELDSLIVYLFYQSKRTQWRRDIAKTISKKLNVADKEHNYDDLFMYEIYNSVANNKAIDRLYDCYDFYLLKQPKPIFFITDSYCAFFESGGEQVIPITSNLALYLLPKHSRQAIPLSLKANIANIITENEYIVSFPLFAANYQRFAFGSYTEENCTLIPKLYKLLRGLANR